jgi:OmcA/MtrC family decaheme c-type cytochrome
VTSISVNTSASAIVTVTFSLKDAGGVPVVGAEAKNFDFQIAKLMPASTSRPAYWQSYINRSESDAANVFVAATERTKPKAVDGQPGVYTYTFCTDLDQVKNYLYYGSGTEPATGACPTTVVSRSGPLSGSAWDAFRPSLSLAYDPAATTRVTLVGRDGAFVNLVQDFVPSQLPTLATAVAKQVVTDTSCGACHAVDSAKRGAKLHFGESGHFSRRFQVEVCTQCHNSSSFNPETSSDTAWNTIDFGVLIHQYHGDPANGYTQNSPFGGVGAIGAGWNGGVAARGVINCRTCHDNQNPRILPQQPANRAAADKAAWAENLSQQACGSCHNGDIATAVDFTDHFGNQPGNEQCGLCHGPGKSEPVPINHATPYSTANNPELSPGAVKVEYQIASVTVNAANGRPTVKFRILLDGTPLNLTALPPNVTVTGVNIRLAWSAPMPTPAPLSLTSGPGIASPLDWNNFGALAGGRTYWNNTVDLDRRAYDQPPSASVSSIIASLTGPDGQGYYTTLEGIVPAPGTPLAFPLDATLKAVAIESYLTVYSMNISGVAAMKGVDGADTLKRTIVDTELCNTCHERVGFHSNAGRWAEARYCATCHNPEVSSSNLYAGPKTVGTETYQVKQQSNNFKDMIHSIHAGAIREEQNPDDPFNFIRGNPAGGSGQGINIFQNVVYPAQISDCKSCHVAGTYGMPSNASYAWSVFNAEFALGATQGAFNPTLSQRWSPSTAACGSCHNSASAKAHFTTFTVPGGEGCATCHGEGKIVEGHK